MTTSEHVKEAAIESQLIIFTIGPPQQICCVRILKVHMHMPKKVIQSVNQRLGQKTGEHEDELKS